MREALEVCHDSSIIDSRDIPLEWIVREYQQVCGPRCPVEVQENVAPAVVADDEELQHAVNESWWSAWTSFSTPAQQLPLSPNMVECTAHPLALGYDGLLVTLTAILGILVALKAGVHSFLRRIERQAHPVPERA